MSCDGWRDRAAPDRDDTYPNPWRWVTTAAELRSLLGSATACRRPERRRDRFGRTDRDGTGAGTAAATAPAGERRTRVWSRRQRDGSPAREALRAGGATRDTGRRAGDRAAALPRFLHGEREGRLHERGGD